MSFYHYNLGTCFDAIVSSLPDGVALRYSSECISFAKLDLWSWQLVALLLQHGLQRGDVIAIGHNKHPSSYAMMLAALKMGIPYVNIDVASPLERNARILETAKPKILSCDDPEHRNSMLELANSANCQLLLLDPAQLPTITDTFLVKLKQITHNVDGSSIAYIMFTSGSTGIPKGVAVTHQNVLHFINWGKFRFDISSSNNFANLSPMYFDNSVFDFYVGLFSGASLTPVPRELMTKPYDLVRFVHEMGCNVWFSVPSLLIYLVAMKALVPKELPSLRAIVFGGEGYPKVELKKLFDSFSPQASIVNVYGPTECTCICSAYTLDSKDFRELEGLPTLGQLNPNFDYRILDESDQDSNSGELCLIGPNVAAGYFNDLERTASAFFTLPDSNRFMKRMYRTGDLVREDGGYLFFVGRKDNQIKHMGYRIELEEIEHGLTKLDHVNQAAVIYQRRHTAYGKLIGFVAVDKAVDEKQLLRDLSLALPEYMIPSRLIIMDDLPKNANGKVDRNQLKTLVE